MQTFCGDKVITITKALEDGNTVIKLAEENKEIKMEQLLGDYSSIVERIVKEQVEIPFETITKNEENTNEGSTNKIVVQGKNGLKEINKRTCE